MTAPIARARRVLAIAAPVTAVLVTTILAVGWTDAGPVNAGTRRLDLTASSQPGQPVAGHEYQFYVDVTSVTRTHNIGLDIDLSAGLTLTSGAPAHCYTDYDGLTCFYFSLARGQTVPLTLTTRLARRLAAGTPVSVSARAHYDAIRHAHAGVTRYVTSPPPSPSPTPTHSRSPSPSPTPTHSRSPSPSPSPSHSPSPSPSPTHARSPSPSPSPVPSPPHRSPQPFQGPVPPIFAPAPSRTPGTTASSPPEGPRPNRTVYFAPAAKLRTQANGGSAPVIPFVVLLTVVLAPCVAAAVMRFGRGR
jgi:hypothetical protein